MHFTEYHTRLAAYTLLVNEADQVLLTWFTGGPDRLRQRWSLPGGGVDFDESLEDAARREAYEETGYDVEVGPLLLIHHFTQPAGGRLGRPYRSQRFVFGARIIGGELGTTEVDGTTAFAQWVPLADFPLRESTADIVTLALEARERSTKLA